MKSMTDSSDIANDKKKFYQQKFDKTSFFPYFEVKLKKRVFLT